MRAAVRKSVAVAGPVSVILVALGLACSSGSGGGGADSGGDTATGADVSIDVIVDDMNCVPPGTANNAEGVGGYCSPGAGQCSHAGPGGQPRYCTADVPSTPAHAWFCTWDCSSGCGMGASCSTLANQGMQCVPTTCAYLAGDSGTDSGGDAASDAVSDVVSDAVTDSSGGDGGTTDASDSGPTDASDGG
jgi:hypothetical protein